MRLLVAAQRGGLGVEGMAFLLIVLMGGILATAMVLSKGRSFFKYAEMSRTLQSGDKSARRTQHRERAAR
jgi:hypothetical protein